jgi:predicted O-methyltransferase YrrM
MEKADIRRIAAGGGVADEKLISEIKQISMLHPETLRILWNLAAMSRGPILELGPYVGGSTIALAKGSRSGSGAPIITVEKGGRHGREAVPTADILADLRNNLARFEVANGVTILEGHNNAPEIEEKLSSFLSGEKIGVLFIDADRKVTRDFSIYRKYLADDAFIILDDYESDIAPNKAASIRPFVERGIKDGVFCDLGVYQWGTRVGIYRPLL